MKSMRPLFISTFPPEKCGLATFTMDSMNAVDSAAEDTICSVAAIKKTDDCVHDDPRVVHTIDNSRCESYRMAADVANDGPCDVVSLQHEFGLFSGPWGVDLLEFMRACRKPIVSTFHTLMLEPEQLPRQLIRIIADRSRSVVVMTHIAAKILGEVYGIRGSKVHVIPHGVPNIETNAQRSSKMRLQLAERQIIFSFGLISRGKGLEHVIESMPQIVTQCPTALYLVVGATHPEVKRHEGEAYREYLIAMANELGVAAHVKFVDSFLPMPELKQYLQACDIFVTPYPGKDQIASGTLAYALSAGCATISTPYLYAQEALENGRGQLVPFCDRAALADATIRFLTNDPFRISTGAKAYEYARPMVWPNVGRSYLKLFQRVASPIKTLVRPSIRDTARTNWNNNTAMPRLI
jgi:glycosyltransferase involved in cell wall biosynthesis